MNRTVLSILALGLFGLVPVLRAGIPLYQFPVTGSRGLAPSTSIIIRPGGAIDPASLEGAGRIAATGSISGPHTGRTILADEGRTILFQPDRPFADGESVTAELRAGVRTTTGDAVPSHSFSFTTSLKSERTLREPMADELTMAANNISRNGVVPRFLPRVVADTIPHPSDFPYTVIKAFDNPTPGQIYMSNIALNGETIPYLFMLDASGGLFYARRIDAAATDYKLQPNGHFTHAILSPGLDVGSGSYVELDSNQNVVDSIRSVGEGVQTNGRELLILPNGHYMLMGVEPYVTDMSALVAGGKPDAQILGYLVQELDKQKNVVWQWRSRDHFQPTDATHEVMTAATIDYIHSNAIDIDTDGNILLSSRNSDEITKISRENGNVIWRWGGKNNQFTFTNDTNHFSHQHDARRLPNGNILMFDNGNFHNPPFSRAVEYRLDETAKTAEVVWEFRNTPSTYSFAMGSARRLPDGNTVIGWGATSSPAITEVRPNGTKTFELALPPGIVSYRALKFPAVARPVAGIDNADEAGGVSLALAQNAPNPASGIATFTFSVPARGAVRLSLFRTDGAEVATLFDGMAEAGSRSVMFDAANLPSGAYIYRLTGVQGTASRMMTVVH
ncbi:MAG: aryl-sulfate sulfotransferase [Candidatus Kapaibacterium sp.]